MVGPHLLTRRKGVADAFAAFIDRRGLVQVDLDQLPRVAITDDPLLVLDRPCAYDDDARFSGPHFVFLGLGRHDSPSARS
jgi:hypothetical protein